MRVRSTVLSASLAAVATLSGACGVWAFAPSAATLDEFAPPAPVPVRAQTNALALTQAVKKALGNVSVAIDDMGGLRAVQGIMKAPTGKTPAQRAKTFVRRHVDFFHGDQLVVDRVLNDGSTTHVRFLQKVAGLPVHGASAAVHFLGDETIGMVTTDLADVDLTPERAAAGIDEAAARAAALANLGTTDATLRGPVTLDRVLVPSGRGALVAWRVRVPASEPLGDWELLVDTSTSEVVGRTNNLTYVTGTGTFYETNPLQCEPSKGPLDNMTALPALVGPYAKVVNDDEDGASETTGEYHYAPDDTHFDEVMVFHHLNRIHDYFKTEMGYAGLDKVMQATVHYGTNYDNAFFSPWSGGFCFGDGNRLNDLSKEAAVVYHEYTHAVTSQIVSMAYSAESGAMNEGFSDYFGCILTNDPKLGEWTVKKLGKPWMRNLEDELHYPEDIQGEVHADGRIWGCILWDLKKALGTDVASKVIHKCRYYLSYKAKFVDGLRGLLQADQALFDGAHKETITTVLAKRGVALPAEAADTADQRRFREMYQE